VEKAARRQRGGERREEILAVSLRLFAQHGMAAVTTRQIARAVGISQPSLYAHFTTADEIGEELCLRGFEALGQRFADVLRAPGTTVERLSRLGRAYIEFGLENPDIYRIAFMLESAATLAEKDPDHPGHAAGLNAFGALRNVVRDLRGGLDDEATSALAQSIWASVHGLVSLLLARPGFPWVERERLIADHVAAVSHMAEAAATGR
jgi:AcrR family transcriptional regulator